jgi:hydrogenase maturation protease
MRTTESKVLVYGYGNPARGDDGLGPALAAALEDLNLPGTTVESNYQLVIEDAVALSEHDAAIFVDADLSGPEPFRFDRVQPQRQLSFSTHSVTPGMLLTLAADLFAKKVPGYVLGIRGYEFDFFLESLSHRAEKNLERALDFLRHALVERKFEAYPRRYGTGIRRLESITQPESKKVVS